MHITYGQFYAIAVRDLEATPILQAPILANKESHWRYRMVFWPTLESRDLALDLLRHDYPAEKFVADTLSGHPIIQMVVPTEPT